ncbi:MAG: T9SS type A sorting domain-containing protein [Chitinophagaceae bacterium]|nr:MAG: T9SS type A sorting domain-containing protein [Chitinophagaceae bacterium]
MKKIILLIVLLFSMVSNAQRFDWVATAGYQGVANSYNGAVVIARDSQGNLYTLDSANATQQCQGMTANPAGGTSIFLYKFNALGEVIYMKPIGTNFKPLNVVVGENDNVYVLGSLMGTNEILINNQTLIDTENRNYIFKLDPAGNLIWKVKNNVSFGNFTEASMLLFSNNHIYFQTGGLSISKLNTAGQFVATLTADAFSSATSATGVFFRGAGVLSNGDLVFSATSRGTITYGTNVFAPTYNSFLHVAMLTIRTTDSLGFVWGSYTNGLRDPDKNVIPMTVGNDDGIYLGLQISGTVTAGPDTVISEDTSGTTIGGILKMDADGNKIWVKSTTNNLHNWSLLNNPDGSGILCGGQIFGFQPVALGQTAVNPLNGNSFITKINYSGVFQNSFSFSQGPIGSYVRSLATDNSGVFYTGGILNNTTSPVFSCISREGNTGLYLAKFTEQADIAPQPFISSEGNTLIASPTFSGTIQWFLDDEAITGANGQTYNATETGNYKVSFSHVPACTKTSTVFDFEFFNSGCWQTLSAGGGQTLAIKPDGTLWGWGENASSQLGDGTSASNPIPAQIGTATNWLKVSTNTHHTLAIKTDGTLWAWGGNQYGQVGDGTNIDKNTPVQIGTDTNWKAVEAGILHSIALKTDGTIWSWGGNMFHQLGDGTSINRNFPAQIGTESDWASINSNSSHTMAIKNNGTLWSWGGNSDGQLGDGTLVFRSNPVQVGTDSNWAKTSTGGGYTVAIKNNGTLWSWGDNIVGQLGNGTVTDQLIPVQVGTGTDWSSVSTGYFFTIALKTNGTLWGWGLNTNGYLGNGGSTDALFPIPIGNATDWHSIDAALNHTSALKNDGSLSAWGVNNAGGLGDGTTIGKNIPTAISCPDLEFNFVQQNLAAGGLHSLFVCENGTTTGTGNNFAGQLGIGTSGNIIVTPFATNGLTDIISVAAKNQFSLFLKSDGTVGASGENGGGQLGIGTTDNVNSPVQIPNLNGVVKIAAGFYHSLFLKSDGTVWACGSNFSGELGIGNQVQQNSPVHVSSLTNVVDIAAGDGISMFLMSNGTVKSCGDNQDYALGIGYGPGPTSPVLVNIPNVASIGAGFRHSIFVKTDGTVWAAGNNGYGKLGTGIIEAQEFPNPVLGLTGIISATAGQYHALYLKNDGTAWASGFNSMGQLGNGNNDHQSIAVQVANLNNVTSIAASGYYHSLFSTTDNQFYACGQNGGALGNGNGENANIPVLVLDNCVPLATETFDATTLTIYPNPSSGILNVSSDKLQDVLIEIYDLNGRMVFSDKNFNTQKTIDIQHLQSGMYLVKLIAEEISYTQKIIKY